MSKIDLDPITSGYNLSKINANFQKVEDELNNKVLYRDSPAGEPNNMSSNLDMNSQSILNASKISSNVLELGGVQVVPTSMTVDPYNGTREALRRSYAEAGYNLVNGSFEAGGTLVNANDVLLHEASGKAYSWDGLLPKSVPDNSIPGNILWIDKSTSYSEVNVRHFGAVSDYYLPDGSVNPAPTDNFAAFTAALMVSKSINLGKGDKYFIGQSLPLPQNAKIYGNGSEVFFDGDGFDLGGGIWNSASFYDISVRHSVNSGNKSSAKHGRAIYSDSAYLVYNVMRNVYIDGFEYGIKTICTSQDNANWTWASIENLKIEYCDYGVYQNTGWHNAAIYTNLVANFIKKCPVWFENLQQNSVTFNVLTIEQSCYGLANKLAGVMIVSPVTLSMNILNSYVEALGYYRAASAAEVTNFKTNGAKIGGLFYDSKSWLLNGEIYSEDTGQITPEDLGENAFVGIRGAGNTNRLSIINTSTQLATAPLICFTDSSLTVNVDSLFNFNAGYSFPNVREWLTNKTAGHKPIVITKNLKNSGGGRNINYGHKSIVIEGDLFTEQKTSGPIHITNDVKYKDVGRGWFPELPLYTTDLIDLYDLVGNGETRSFYAKDDLILNATPSRLDDYAGQNSANTNRGIEILNGGSLGTVTLGWWLKQYAISWDGKLKVGANLRVVDNAATAEERPTLYFNTRDLTVTGTLFFATSNNVAPVSGPSTILNKGKLTVGNGISTADYYTGLIKTNGHFRDGGLDIVGAMSNGVINSVRSYYAPNANLYQGLRFYSITNNLWLTYTGAEWRDPMGNVVVPPSI